jgi:hypothetical protein
VQQALTTSLRRGMSREECTANFTLGRISGAIGDLPEAYQLFCVADGWRLIMAILIFYGGSIVFLVI